MGKDSSGGRSGEAMRGCTSQKGERELVVRLGYGRDAQRGELCDEGTSLERHLGCVWDGRLHDPCFQNKSRLPFHASTSILYPSTLRSNGPSDLGFYRSCSSHSQLLTLQAWDADSDRS